MDIGILLGLLRTCVGSRRGESSLAARRSGATRSTPSRASRRLAEEAGKKATARSLDAFRCVEAGWALMRVFRFGLLLQDRRKSDYWDRPLNLISGMLSKRPPVHQEVTCLLLPGRRTGLNEEFVHLKNMTF
jgi:hypothetical protein